MNTYYDWISLISYRMGSVSAALKISMCSILIIAFIFLAVEARGNVFRSVDSGIYENKKKVAQKEAPDRHSYYQEEVRIPVNEKIVLAGTLMLPDTLKDHPVAVLVSGSMPDNRDAEIAGFKPFLIMSRYLASKGIGTLRYDDRGVDKSSGNNVLFYSVDELAEDIDRTVDWLKSHRKVDATQIGIIAHSFGGMWATKVVSKRNDLAFLVTMATPAVEPEELNPSYRIRVYQRQNLDRDEIARRMSIERHMFDVQTVDEEKEMARKMRSIKRVDYNALNPTARDKFGDFETYFRYTWFGLCLPFINTPFIKSWMQMNPARYLSEVKIPSLFLFGARDRQVRMVDSDKIIRKAMKKANNTDYIIKDLPQAGHYFTSFWGAFAPGVLNQMANWISTRLHPG